MFASPEETWTELWKNTSLDDIPDWDQLSDLVNCLMCDVVKSFRDKIILEGGSGTGRISLKLAKEKDARVILLDVSKRMIKHSMTKARSQRISGSFVIGSIFALPFREECLDVIWSSGVLEHFDFERQQRAIEESLRCLRNFGFAIIIVPNKWAIGYNLMRLLSMKIGTWPVGYEEPLSSKEFQKFRPPPRYIHSSGFFLQFSVVFVPTISTLLKSLIKIVQYLLKERFHLLDRKIPGYLLTGIFVKT